MWLIVTRHSSRIFLALALLAFVLAIQETYEKYRGTGLSRVPVGGGQLEAAESTATEAPRVTARPASYLRVTPPKPYVDDELQLYPTVTKGMRTPFDLWRYYGRDVSSFNSPILPMRFEQWLEFHRKQKPQLMADVRDYMNERYDFSEEAIPGQFMTGGKPVMLGPVRASRLGSVVRRTCLIGPRKHPKAGFIPLQASRPSSANDRAHGVSAYVDRGPPGT